MSSIRKTKKRLKREIDELWAEMAEMGNIVYPTLQGDLLYEALYMSVDMKEYELENLKRKKK